MDPMDITKMLHELRSEREGVEQAILVLERIARGRGRRRGRPPAWMTGRQSRGTRTYTRSPAARARMAEAARRRWAKRKRAKV